MRQKLPAGKKDKVIFIVGPTAVGKSQMAYELAKKINGEIISCDSMQIYRHMDIMSQAPPKKWRKSIPHYLIGVLGPHKEYSAAKFRTDAEKLIKNIIKRKKTPLIVGGSGLYIKALLNGLFPSPGKDLILRKKLEKEAKIKGSKHLHIRLKKIDPKSTAEIHPNDLRRIIRALELYYLTGLSKSEHKKRTRGIAGKYNIEIIGINMPREKLYKTINNRVDKMFRQSLISEIQKLSKKKLSVTARASLGYKEVLGYLNGEYSLGEAKELLKKNTRRLAKKQLTWFRADKRIKWLG